MKKVLLLCSAVSLLMLSSCAVVQTPVAGLWFTDVKSPVAVTGNEGSSKVGTSSASSILGVIATGDASVEAAAKSAGITKIHHVDAHATSILGIVAKYQIFVYGE